MNFAIIGASGNVGRKTIEILEKSKIPFKELFLVASKKSAGKKIKFRDKEIIIENLENYDFSKAEITFFAAGSQIAKEWAPKAAKKTIVIDNSSYFRMQKDVPLVVPEVNSEALENIIILLQTQTVRQCRWCLHLNLFTTNIKSIESLYQLTKLFQAQVKRLRMNFLNKQKTFWIKKK